LITLKSRKLWQIANNNDENSKILDISRINKARNASLLNDLNRSGNQLSIICLFKCLAVISIKKTNPVNA
jgi:hypothetical protein